MGTTAEKLTYLNDTKQLLKENINNLGGNLTNEPFRQYASVLEGIYESLPKVSGIGASLSLSPSLMGKIKLNEIQGDTLQENTPTPSSPVPIQSVTGLQNVNVCGKNLLNIQGIVKGRLDNGVIGYESDTSELTLNDNSFSFTTTKNYRGVTSDYINVEENATYIYSMSTTYNQIGIVVAYYDINKVFISDYNVAASAEDKSFTTPNNSCYIRMYFYRNNASSVTIENPQLEKGSTATTYEPYKGNTYEVNLGNIELNKIGTYEDSIKKSTGKNLFDKDNVNVLKCYPENTTLVSHENSRTIYIQCSPNTTYTIQKRNDGSTNRFRVATSQSTPTIGATIMQDTGNHHSDTNLTITTNSTANYLLVWCFVASETTLTFQQILDSIMINEGSTALPYEPYGKVWYIQKNIGKVVLDGSNDENWNLNTTRTNTVRYRLPNTFNNMERVGYDYNTYCNYATAQNVYSNDVEGYFLHYPTEDSNSTLYFSINKSTASTLEQLKIWLNTHNLEVIYVLATPIYEVITNTELIEQLESLNNAKSEDGTTNINVTSEDLSMILNVSVLKGE